MIWHILEIVGLIYAGLVVIQFVMLERASRHAPIIEDFPRCPDYVPEHWGIRER